MKFINGGNLLQPSNPVDRNDLPKGTEGILIYLMIQLKKCTTSY